MGGGGRTPVRGNSRRDGGGGGNDPIQLHQVPDRRRSGGAGLGRIIRLAWGEVRSEPQADLEEDSRIRRVGVHRSRGRGIGRRGVLLVAQTRASRAVGNRRGYDGKSRRKGDSPATARPAC